MKLCGFTCILASIVIVANMVMTYYMSVENTMKKYETQLSPELRKKYVQIANERKQIYMLGYLFGFFLSIFLVIFLSVFRIKYFSSIYSNICFIIVITYFTSVAFYMHSPKTDWMLNHIEDKEQAKAWLNMYQYMKNHYHSSFHVSLIAVSVFLIAFGCDRFTM
jgi:uncharacterized protein YacL